MPQAPAAAYGCTVRGAIFNGAAKSYSVERLEFEVVRTARFEEQRARFLGSRHGSVCRLRLVKLTDLKNSTESPIEARAAAFVEWRTEVLGARNGTPLRCCSAETRPTSPSTTGPAGKLITAISL